MYFKKMKRVVEFGINLIIYRLSPPLIVINMLTNLILTQTCQNDDNLNTQLNSINPDSYSCTVRMHTRLSNGQLLATELLELIDDADSPFIKKSRFNITLKVLKCIK